MWSLQRFLIEKSLHKLDTLLRNDVPADGYVSLVPVLGPVAPSDICKRAQALDDDIKRGVRRVTVSPIAIRVASLIPTQPRMYLDDVKDIARKGVTGNPIQVMLYQGRYYIINGHHRAAAAAVLGRSSINTHLISWE